MMEEDKQSIFGSIGVDIHKELSFILKDCESKKKRFVTRKPKSTRKEYTRKPQTSVAVDFVNLLRNVIHVFFHHREITTSSFYDILVKLHKGYETTEGLKPHEGSTGRVYKRTQEIIRVLRFLGVLSH